MSRGRKQRKERAHHTGYATPIWSAADVRSFAGSEVLTVDDVDRIVEQANASRETTWKDIGSMVSRVARVIA